MYIFILQSEHSSILTWLLVHEQNLLDLVKALAALAQGGMQRDLVHRDPL